MNIGILGGGQLGRMLALAGHPLGFSFVVVDPTRGSSASPVTVQNVARYDDENALAELVRSVDVVTFEFENVPAEAANYIQEHGHCFPPAGALEVAQDRLSEKTLFQKLGIPTAPFEAVSNLTDLHAAVERLGTPCVLKTRRLGYDGKGQCVLKETKDIEQAWNSVGQAASILESWVPFDRELSIIAARARDGAVVHYPLTENRHAEGILRFSRPLTNGSAPQPQAEAHMQRLLEELNYVGVLCLELFEHGGSLLANEMAPRVHNSGHWTIEGAEISQFENHLRAIANLPLGSTALRGVSAMFNLVGMLPEPRDILAVPGAHLHVYGKAVRPRRKVGHITVTASDTGELDKRVERISRILSAG